MEIIAYSFDKRGNSTARPSGTGSGESLDGVLKDNCSILNPSLMLLAWHFEYNYVYIPDFSRYYYVTDVTLISNSRVIVSLRCDVLASYKPAILTTQAYVLRASKASNVQIPDVFYPTLSGTWQSISSATFIDITTPSFIIGVIGGTGVGSITGAVNYFVVSETDLATITSNVFDQTHYGTDISDNVVKTFFNPMQYMTTCMYCPFLASSGGSEGITMGWWDTGVDGTKIGPRITLDDISLNIPRTNENDDNYINYEPWTHYRLYIPYIGFIDIASNQLRGNASIIIKSQIDTSTGELMCWINGNNGRRIATARGQCCANIPIAQTQATIGLTGESALSLAGFGAKAVGDLLGGSLGGSVSDIGTALLANTSQLSINGKMGNISERFFETNVMLILDASHQTVKDNDLFGSPLCETRELSDLQGGYVRCLDAKIKNTVVLEDERTEIESLLNGGIFLE